MELRSWLLRRAMGRLRITEDIVRHLSTFQRLGETLEVQVPGELLPIGARTVFRALRTRAAAQIGVDWVWPYWLERQLDPCAQAFIPRGHLPVLTNVTHRNWTMVGNLDSPREAIVDTRGLVTPWFDAWSLDWWVGDADGWHFPSRRRDVRQGLVDSRPVVETVISLAGGEVAERVYAVSEDEEAVVAEIENRCGSVVRVALAVRPYNPEGLAVIERIGLVDNTLTVDGRRALRLITPPDGYASSDFHRGDVVERVVAGDLTPSLASVTCRAGLAQAAVVYNLPPSASIRAVMPLVPEHRTRRRRLMRRRAGRHPLSAATLPTGAATAHRWADELQRGMRLVLPEGRLAEAVEANRAFLLLFLDGDEITAGPFTYHRFWFRDAAFQLAALGRYGFHSEVAEVLRSYPRRQHRDGYFFSQRQEWDSNGAAIWAIAEHWRLNRDRDLVRALAPSIARGAEWIEHKRHTKRRRNDEALRALMPASISAEHLGPFDYFYWDNFWSLRGLLDAAELLKVAGEEAAAADAARWAVSLRTDLEQSTTRVAQRLGLDRPAIPAGPRRRLDPAMIGSLVAAWPLGLLPADDPAVVATADVLRERFCVGPAFYQGISHTGLGTYLTLQLAFVELVSGDERALARLEWMLEAATSTFSWPEAIHPSLGGGCMGDGHHGWAAADFLSFVRCLLVREDDDGLALCAMLPAAWRGRDLAVERAPTHHGLLSFSLSYEGDRGALRWTLEPHDEDAKVRVSAPGLSPAWSSFDRSGEVVVGGTPEP